MGCAETELKAEGPVFWGILYEIQSLLSGETGKVYCIIPYGLIKIASFILFVGPVINIIYIIKLIVFFVIHSEFPEETCVISCFPQQPGICQVHILVFDIPGLKVEPMCSFIQSGKQAGPTGSTNGGCDHGPAEIHPTGGQFVHFRSLNHVVPGISKCIPTLVVGEYENDIGRWGTCFRKRG